MTSYTNTPIQSKFTLITWADMTTDDQGDAISLPGKSDRSVQFTGSFNGGSVTFQGSNVEAPSVDSDWFPLTDPVGDPITLTSAGGRAVSENALHYRPVVTGGTSPSITCRFFSKSTK